MVVPTWQVQSCDLGGPLRVVRLSLKVVMQNDCDREDAILLYTKLCTRKYGVTSQQMSKKKKTECRPINEDINPKCVGFMPENKIIGNLVLMVLCCKSV